jgi:hypothetical protein
MQENKGVLMVPHGTVLPATAGNAGVYLDTRSDLVKQIEKLEHDSEALGRVRATIAVNFSPERATDGIVIEKHPSVLHMLIAVIEAYRKKLTECQQVNNEQDQPGWCGHCACQSCYEAQQRNDC